MNALNLFYQSTFALGISLIVPRVLSRLTVFFVLPVVVNFFYYLHIFQHLNLSFVNLCIAVFIFGIL